MPDIDGPVVVVGAGIAGLAAAFRLWQAGQPIVVLEQEAPSLVGGRMASIERNGVFTRTVRNNAHTHILGALKTAVHEIPYEVTGLDFDNGSEFLNKAVIKWAGEMEIFFTGCASSAGWPSAA